MGLVVFLAMDFSGFFVFFFVYGNGRTGEKLQRKEEEFINELRTARGGRVE